MKTIIIYYSQTESTRKVAETLALSLKADICEVKDLKERDGLKNRFGSLVDAFRENKTEIYPPVLNLEEYGTVYFGTPTWANNAAPAIITMIDRCDLFGKDVVLFATMSNSGGDSAIEKMEKKVKARGARVFSFFSFYKQPFIIKPKQTTFQIHENLILLGFYFYFSKNFAKLIVK